MKQEGGREKWGAYLVINSFRKNHWSDLAPPTSHTLLRLRFASLRGRSRRQLAKVSLWQKLCGGFRAAQPRRRGLRRSRTPGD